MLFGNALTDLKFNVLKYVNFKYFQPSRRSETEVCDILAGEKG